MNTTSDAVIEFHPAGRHLADLAALAKEKQADLVTGDPDFKALEKEIKMLWLTGKA